MVGESVLVLNNSSGLHLKSCFCVISRGRNEEHDILYLIMQERHIGSGGNVWNESF